MSDETGQSGANQPPVRVVVQRDTTRVRGLRPVRELAERTPVGDAYLRSLIRTQLALAFRLLIILFAVLAGVPLLLLFEPRMRTYRIADVPIGWLIIGGAFYPLFIGLAAVFVRRAERNEMEFIELVRDSEPGGSARR